MADRLDVVFHARSKVATLIRRFGHHRQSDGQGRPHPAVGSPRLVEWTITADDLDRLTADIWPGAHGPAPEISSVQGAKPKKPPLTQAGEWALDRIEKHVNDVTIELGGLSERALKGLAFEAHRMSTLEDEVIWRGVADEAKRWGAIRAAERTGKGDWYAVIEVSKEDRDHPRVMEEIAVARAKGSSRNEAIEAGRKLMAEKVEWLDAGTFVEVTLRSALEWRPDDWA